MVLEHNNIKYNSGQEIIFKIQGVTLVGKLFIHAKNEFYLCHDDNNFCGNDSPDKLGFTYSWVFHKTGNTLSDNVELIAPILNIKENFKVGDRLKSFLMMIGRSSTSYLLSCGDFLPGYNDFEVSPNKGLITIKDTNLGKVVEMKVGRIFNSLDKTFDFFNLNDKDLESIHNSYILFQQDDYLNTIKDIKGKDILKYYKKENYQYDNTGCRLLSSCMNDRDDFLQIYTENKSVSLIAVEQLGRVVGRCLLWELSDGRKLMDRRYTSFDWVDFIFDNLREEEGYLNFDTQEEVSVKLENSEFEKYPYLDTFRYLCKDTNTLFNNYRNDKYKYILDRTCGNIVNR